MLSLKMVNRENTKVASQMFQDAILLIQTLAINPNVLTRFVPIDSVAKLLSATNHFSRNKAVMNNILRTFA